MEATPASRLREAAQDESGLIIRAYALDDIENIRSGNLPQISGGIIPQYTGTTNTVHFPESEAFSALPQKVMLQLSGYITIEQAGKFFLNRYG